MLQKALPLPDAGGLRTVFEELRAADLVFANLEVVLTDRQEAADKLVAEVPA